MIRICSKCGAFLTDVHRDCTFCRDASASTEATARHSLSAKAAPRDPEPEWRTEVSRRLEVYRTRHGRAPAARQPVEETAQSELHFRRTANAKAETYVAPEPLRARRLEHSTSRALRTAEPMEICIQPELDFSTAARDRARPQNALVPVSSFRERIWGIAVDAGFVALTLGGFAAVFRSLGGELSADKITAGICVAVAYLVYALYFCLFVTLAGATPGMQLRGLTIVRLDGSLPDTRQLVWRSFGYLLSGATLLLGFVWALWDEDQFTWQDRISQTYVTAANPLSDADLVTAPSRLRRPR